jgi:hypothetical protein
MNELQEVIDLDVSSRTGGQRPAVCFTKMVDPQVPISVTANVSAHESRQFSLITYKFQYSLKQYFFIDVYGVDFGELISNFIR